jgi:flagellar motor switch protein FliM
MVKKKAKGGAKSQASAKAKAKELNSKHSKQQTESGEAAKSTSVCPAKGLKNLGNVRRYATLTHIHQNMQTHKFTYAHTYAHINLHRHVSSIRSSALIHTHRHVSSIRSSALIHTHTHTDMFLQFGPPSAVGSACAAAGDGMIEISVIFLINSKSYFTNKRIF